MPKFRADQFLSLFLVVVAILFQPALVASYHQTEPIKFTPNIDLVQPVPVPVLKDPKTNPESLIQNISAQSLYVMDLDSGSILLEKKSHDLRFPASTTKMMTALVARKIYKMDHALTVKSEAFTEGTTMGLILGEQITVENLLKGLLITSGNDAAFVLANNYPLGYDGFIGEMNSLAKDLHLDQTTFSNPSGLDEPQHQTTARDFAILAKELMKDDLLKDIVGTQKITVSDNSGLHQHLLRTTNDLLGKNGVVGIKTGTTLQAGETLITQVNKDNHQVIIVIMSSLDRYGETNQIIEWVFNNYEWIEINPELTKLL